MKTQYITLHYKQIIEITEAELRNMIQEGAIEVDEDGDVVSVDITHEVIYEAYDHTDMERDHRYEWTEWDGKCRTTTRTWEVDSHIV